ncbi:hypothetical protein AB0I50_47155, partial [Streptomyces prunicolor]
MRRVEHVMGFPVSLRVDDEGIGDEVADALFAWLREVDARFSPFRPDSEVCRYDRAGARSVPTCRTWYGGCAPSPACPWRSASASAP